MCTLELLSKCVVQRLFVIDSKKDNGTELQQAVHNYWQKNCAK